MSTPAATIFAAMYSALPEARCTVKVGRVEIAQALCPGINTTRQNTDLGQYGAVAGELHMLSASEPGGEIANGTAIEIRQYGRTEWVKARTGARRTIGGVTSFDLEAVHE